MDPQRWKRIQSICEMALTREAGQREAYLREACTGDEELRSEVASFLRCGSDGERFLTSPALQHAARELAKDRISASGANLIGQTFHHYRIIEKIGAGGMGEVYRAHDDRLKRDVAVKVLPDHFVDDPERLARFDREARLLASLNHPNIAAIHGLEEWNGKRFLIMELVEGPTLAERLNKGPLPLDQTLQVCRQIAEGLESAHEKGIIHRDLKPANVKVNPEGRVKILDFGLARAMQTEQEPADLTHSPTITANMTRPGVILGTAAYMSPEQARGETVDKRADIWAFGCVLYECLTGKRAFEGKTVTETLASVLQGQPDWPALPAALSGPVAQLLRRCLQKDPRLRLHDIGDARLEIDDSMEGDGVPLGRRRHWRWLPIAGIGLLLIAGTALVARWYWRPMTSAPVVRSLFKIGPGSWLAGRSNSYYRWRPLWVSLALSRDGSFVVYSALPENPDAQAKPQIYLRRMDQMTGAPIAGTEGGINPFLSPDSRWIGFWEGKKLKKVPIEGGVTTPLCDAAGLFGADWGSDNSIIFAQGLQLGLSRVSADGGEPESLTVPDAAREEIGHHLPHYLPGGRGVLFTIVAHAQDIRPRLAVLDPGTKKWRILLQDAADGRYVSSGHLVFLRQGTLMAAEFDLRRLEIRGQPAPVVSNVMQALNIGTLGLNTGAGQFSISDSGWLAYVPGGIFPDREDSLVRVDQKGDVQPIADFRAAFFAPRYSPDGRRIAYATLAKEQRVWIYDLERGTATPVTSNGLCVWPVWTPDGKRLVFRMIQSGQGHIWWRAVDENSPMEQLSAGEQASSPGSFTPDGATLAFHSQSKSTGSHNFLLDIKTRKVSQFLKSNAAESYPEISPDGHWLAYVSNESGREEVRVSSFPGGGSTYPISNGGGTQPLWSKDGKQLFYRQVDKYWATEIRTDRGFSAAKPHLLFEKPGLGPGGMIRTWDLAPDGRSFLMVRLEETKPEPATEIMLVQNWFEELKRLVPSGKK